MGEMARERDRGVNRRFHSDLLIRCYFNMGRNTLHLDRRLDLRHNHMSERHLPLAHLRGGTAGAADSSSAAGDGLTSAAASIQRMQPMRVPQQKRRPNLQTLWQPTLNRNNKLSTHLEFIHVVSC